MNTGEVIFGVLSADPSVAYLVGTRIYPNVAPQGPRPTDSYTAIVYQVISDVPQNAFTGDATDRLRNARVQIDCYARQYKDVQAIADAVDKVISALSRPDLSAWRESSRDYYDNEAQLHRVSMDVNVWR
jgi:hypothetical protein